MEKPQHLLLVAIWQIFCAVIAFLGILTLILFMVFMWVGVPTTDPDIPSVIFLLFAGTGLFFVLVYFIISLVAGIGTIKGASWARNLGIVQAVLNILNVPVGTIIGILIIMYLVRPEVTQYFQGGGHPVQNQPS